MDLTVGVTIDVALTSLSGIQPIADPPEQVRSPQSVVLSCPRARVRHRDGIMLERDVDHKLERHRNGREVEATCCVPS
jgi:hypothetical protein